MKNYILFILLLFVLTGCSSRNFTNTPRSAIEQLLVSDSIDSALEKFEYAPLAGNKVHLDFTNLKCYDSEYVKSAARARFAEMDARFVAEAADAYYIAEIASGAVGTEHKSFLFGIPAIPVPGMTAPLPELALARSVHQSGITKLLITIYSNGKFIDSGHYYGKVERKESFFLWMRSQPVDDVRTRWESADEKLKAKSSEH